jgi:hypothetical protein
VMNDDAPDNPVLPKRHWRVKSPYHVVCQT